MLNFGPSSSDLPKKWLRSPGAFLWWYIDVVDAQGCGAVCIWSYGLPFSPGLASAARAKTPIPPGERPGWNLVIYRDHKPVFYTLQEFDPEDCSWEEDRDEWRMGGTVFRRETKNDRVTVSIDFNCTLVGMPSPVTGQMSFEGPLRQSDEGPRSEHHTWEPLSLGGAHASLQIESDDWSETISGRAYHDRNGGVVPMHEQGIDRWVWGRFAFPDRELVLYFVDHAGGRTEWIWLDVDANGRVIERNVADVKKDRARMSVFGPRWNPTITVTDENGSTVTVTQGPPVDDGPFYLRHIASACVDGVNAPGITEQVVPDKIDLAMHRPLVRMRINGAKPSIWLPLFQGPARGRIVRLVGSWLRRIMP